MPRFTVILVLWVFGVFFSLLKIQIYMNMYFFVLGIFKITYSCIARKFLQKLYVKDFDKRFMTVVSFIYYICFCI